MKYPEDYINKVICGDCLEVMKDIPDKSVDLVLTDPPYFLPAKHYATRTQFRRNFSDLGILESFFKGFFVELERILKNNGLFFMFCDGQSYPLFFYYSYFFTKAVRPLIWDKKTAYTGYYWRHQHEIILFGVMPESKPIPTGYGDVLKFNAVRVGIRKHPAEKPVDLIRYIFENTPNEKNIILDPFLGSGTTAIAAKQLGRNFIGIEINPDYCKIAEDRLLQTELFTPESKINLTQDDLFSNKP